MFIFFDSFCLFFIMSTPHLSPSPFYPHLVPPPLHMQTPVGVPMKGRGAGGAYTLLRGEGEGEQCVMGGGLYVSGC